MKRGSILRYLLIPTLVGLAATWLVYRYVAPEQARASVETVQVVVAQASVPPRTVLGRNVIALRPFPKAYLPKGAMTSLDGAVGKVTVAPLATGEVVLASHLASAESKVALAYHVPAGKRAITIPVNEVTGVAGFIQPGDHVDVVAVLGGDQAGGGAATPRRAQLLTQDALVLAVGQRQDSDAQTATGNLTGYTSLTLALSPQDALRLSLAAAEGSILATLRPAADDAPATTRVVTDADLTP